MVKGISRDLIRNYLDELRYSTLVSDDGNYYTFLRADKDFDHDVIIFFNVEDNWLGVYGYASDFEVNDSNKGRVIMSLNEFNANSRALRGYLLGDLIRFEQYFLLDEEVSDAYIKENCIKMTAGLIWRAFCGFNK